MLQDLGRVSDALKAAAAHAGKGEAEKALAALDRAASVAENIRQKRNQVLRDTEATWYESWLPRVAEANGRRFLDKADDVKDHQPVRTIDMSYLVYRELLYPLGDWVDKVTAARNEYASAHKLPARNNNFNWKDTSTTITAARTANDEDN